MPFRDDMAVDFFIDAEIFQKMKLIDIDIIQCVAVEALEMAMEGQVGVITHLVIFNGQRGDYPLFHKSFQRIIYSRF